MHSAVMHDMVFAQLTRSIPTRLISKKSGICSNPQFWRPDLPILLLPLTYLSPSPSPLPAHHRP